MRLMKFSGAFFFLLTALFSAQLFAQTGAEAHRKIQQLIEKRDYPTAAAELETLKAADRRIFELNNYDYLLARVAEKKGDFGTAAANYQAVVNRQSILKQYALWHLAQIARTTGNLMLERSFLQEILAFTPDSLLIDAVNARILQ